MKNLKSFIDYIKENLEEDDYRGQHRAPSPLSDDSPMYDVDNMFPDMYTENAIKYYAWGDNDKIQSIRMIQSVKNKPNRLVKIYRSIPDLNFDINKKIKSYNDILNYYTKWKFFPPGNDLVNKIWDEEWGKHTEYSYDEIKKRVWDVIYNMVEELRKQKLEPLKINNGDWITLSLNYAKRHGVSNLNGRYKIISKTVPSKYVYTNGDDVLEWGYFKN